MAAAFHYSRRRHHEQEKEVRKTRHQDRERHRVGYSRLRQVRRQRPHGLGHSAVQAVQEVFIKETSDVWFTRLEGGCMRPLLRDGDIVPVRGVLPAGVGAGDIVLYRRSGKAHLHRVWWRSGGNLWIKDDAAIVGLHRIKAAEVLGVLDGPGSFRKGWAGLAFSLAANGMFFLGRLLKGLFRRGTPRPQRTS